MNKFQNLSDKALKFFKSAGHISFKILKWPLLIGLPVVVFMLAAWWSLISALSGDIQVVPDLRGMTVEEARFSLSSRSLTMVTSDNEKFSQEIDKGYVLESEPAPGSKIKRGRSVTVILSSGFRRVLVPNFQMKSVKEAELFAEQKGFKVIQRDSVFSETVPAGHIIAQDPEPNTALVTETVEVLASRGPHPALIMVSHLEGRPLLPVLEALRKKGLYVVVRRRGESRDISNSDPFELRRMEIYRQWPPAGSFIDLSSPEPVILRVQGGYR